MDSEAYLKGKEDFKKYLDSEIIGAYVFYGIGLIGWLFFIIFLIKIF